MIDRHDIFKKDSIIQVIIIVILMSILIGILLNTNNKLNKTTNDNSIEAVHDISNEEILNTQETNINSDIEIVQDPEFYGSIDDNKDITEEEMYEYIEFMVDILEDNVQEEGIIVGNTATLDGYSGQIIVYIDENVLNNNNLLEFNKGEVWKFIVKPMMTMSIPPQVTAVDFEKLDDSNIEKFEEIKSQVSTFKVQMIDYEQMELDSIIMDANMNYATWTQEEIIEFQEFIKNKGYTEENELKSIIRNRQSYFEDIQEEN